MNSSTSSSDALGAGFLRVFVVTAAVVGLAIAALLTLLDPYDTGRLTPLSRPGVPETAPRMASASRIRDPAFNAAIIGNSTIQLMEPEGLKALTGLNFVQLSVPGTGPMEQTLLVERLFALRRGAIDAIVLGLDGTWCDASLETKTANPFPFWLHDSSDAAYLFSLFRMSSLEFLPGRLRVMLMGKKPARRDGYWNYELLYPPPAPAPEPLPTATAPNASAERPAAVGALARLLAAVPRETRVVLVHPPAHINPASPPDAGHRRTVEGCKRALAAVAGRRGGVEIVDFWIDDAAARTSSFFIDPTHYRRPLAERIEAAIAAGLGGRR